MSKVEADTVAVLDTHGFLWCRECAKEHEFDGDYREFTVAELEAMLGPEMHHHTELCDGCGRVWGVLAAVKPANAEPARWAYKHQLAPITEEDKQDPETFFMDGGVNGEFFIIPYKHRAEWKKWINAQAAYKLGYVGDVPEYCTEVADLTQVVFHQYKIA